MSKRALSIGDPSFISIVNKGSGGGGLSVPGTPWALFDAESITGVSDSALLSSWPNEGSSGVPIDDSGFTGSRAPTYFATGGPEGGPRVYFKNKLLDGALGFLPQPLISACVFRTDVADRGTYDPFQRGLNNYECYIQRYIGNLIYGSDSSPSLERDLVGGDPGAGVWGWFIATFNGASSRIIDDRGNVDTGDVGTNGMTGLAFGQNVSGSRWLDGDTCWIGIWPGLATPEEQIEAYLRAKFPSI